MLGGLDRGWEGKGVEELCVDSSLCLGDWLRGEVREWGNCVLIVDFVRGVG